MASRNFIFKGRQRTQSRKVCVYGGRRFAYLTSICYAITSASHKELMLPAAAPAPIGIRRLYENGLKLTVVVQYILQSKIWTVYFSVQQ